MMQLWLPIMFFCFISCVNPSVTSASVEYLIKSHKTRSDHHEGHTPQRCFYFLCSFVGKLNVCTPPGENILMCNPGARNKTHHIVDSAPHFRLFCESYSSLTSLGSVLSGPLFVLSQTEESWCGQSHLSSITFDSSRNCFYPKNINKKHTYWRLIEQSHETFFIL